MHKFACLALLLYALCVEILACPPGPAGPAGPPGFSVPLTLTQDGVLYSNGAAILSDNETFSWDETTATLSLTQPETVSEPYTVLKVSTDLGGAHGYGAHIEIAGNPGGGGTIFRTDGGLDASWLQLCNGRDCIRGGQVYINGINSGDGDAGGVQVATAVQGASFQVLDGTQEYKTLLSVNSDGADGTVTIPSLGASSIVATDASSNLVTRSVASIVDTATSVFTYSMMLHGPSYSELPGGNYTGPWTKPQGPFTVQFTKTGKIVNLAIPFYAPSDLQTGPSNANYIVSDIFAVDPSLQPAAIYGGVVNEMAEFYDGGGNFPDAGNAFPYGTISLICAGDCLFEMYNGNAAGTFSGTGQLATQVASLGYATG